MKSWLGLSLNKTRYCPLSRNSPSKLNLFSEDHIGSFLHVEIIPSRHYFPEHQEGEGGCWLEILTKGQVKVKSKDQLKNWQSKDQPTRIASFQFD